MSADLLWHRVQFGFTLTFRQLFPQLTMGLVLLIVILKVVALHTAKERYKVVLKPWA
jgi:cytochrome d ubiquinol oxidase subunit I